MAAGLRTASRATLDRDAVQLREVPDGEAAREAIFEAEARGDMTHWLDIAKRGGKVRVGGWLPGGPTIIGRIIRILGVTARRAT